MIRNLDAYFKENKFFSNALLLIKKHMPITSLFGLGPSDWFHSDLKNAL